MKTRVWLGSSKTPHITVESLEQVDKKHSCLSVSFGCRDAEEQYLQCLRSINSIDHQEDVRGYLLIDIPASDIIESIECTVESLNNQWIKARRYSEKKSAFMPLGCETPLELKGKTFTLTCKWDGCRGFNPIGTQNPCEDAYGYIITTKTDASARKLYKAVKKSPSTFKEMDLEAFETYCASKRIAISINNTVTW